MNILLLLIPLALIVLVIAGAAFFWAVGQGQFDDLDSPAMRVVLDDDSRPPPRTDDKHNDRGDARGGGESHDQDDRPT